MATKIKHKRSSVPGKKPTVEQLESGEIAINTADGKAYLLKDDNTVQDLTKEIFENDTKISIDDSGTETEGIITTVVDGTEQLRVTASSIQAKNTVEVEDANEIRFKELTASGQNYVGIKAPDNLLGNYTLNLPPSQGTLGQLLSSNGAGFLDWIDADTFGGNVIFVSAEKGDDLADGINAPVKTIKRALQLASDYVYNPDGSPNEKRVAVQVAAGDYTEQNPIIVPDNVIIRGTGLRACIIRPANANKDMLRVRNGCYFAEFTFRDGVDSNFVPLITADYAVAFDDPEDSTVDRSGYSKLPDTKPIITVSPYVQNCSIISFLGMNGAKIDGSKVRSPNTPFRQIEAENPVEGSAPEQGKSMVSNAFTMLSFGGTGWRLTNDAYAQIVSCFQIFLLNGVYTQSGGYCSITNSATNFGLYALRSSGYSRNAFTFDRGYVVATGVSQGEQTLTIIGVKRNEPVEEFILRFREPDYKIQFDLLQSAKEQIASDTIDWINAQVAGAAPGSIWENFTYNEAICERDTKIIIDAISQDVFNAGNSFSVQAGLAYYSGFIASEDNIVIEGQELQTIAAIEYARDEALSYIAALDSEVRASVAEKFDIITGIIADPESAPEPIAVSSQGDITNSFKNIGAEKEFDAATDVNDTVDVITVLSHGLTNGQSVIYDPNGNPEIPGLDAEQTYYVRVINDDEFSLAFDESLDFSVNILGTSTGIHKFLTNVVEFFVNEMVESHQTYQTLILDAGQGDLNFVPGRIISGVSGSSNVSAYVYSWQPLDRRLIVSINKVTVGTSELRVLFDENSTINADHGSPVTNNITIESVAIKTGVGSATFTIRGTVEGSELINTGNLNEKQVWFHRPSIVNSSAHTWEYAGSGIDYNALPQNGGNTRVEFEQFAELPGRVYSSGTNELGDFKVGDFITAFNRTGNITFRNKVQVEELDALRLSLSNVAIEEISTDVALGENEIGGPSNNRLSTQRAIRQFLANRLGGFIDKTVSTAAVPGAIVQLNTNGQLNDDLIPATRAFRNTITKGYRSRLLQVDEIPAVDLSAGDIATEEFEQVEITLDSPISANDGDLITQPSSGSSGYVRGDYVNSTNILIGSIGAEFSGPGDLVGSIYINGVDTGAVPTDLGTQVAVTENYFLRSSNTSQYLVLDPTGSYVYTNAEISTAERTSNVTTIVTTQPHLLEVGNQIRVTSEDDPTYNETGRVLSVPTTTSFTYSNPGSDDTVASISGTVNSVVTAADGGAQGEITELRFGVVTNVDNANITGGSGYTPGSSSTVYSNIALTNVTGTGTGALADITVSNGSVTDVDLRRGGTGYAVGDILSASAGNIGGTGSGFEIEVTAIEKRAYVNILGGELFVASSSSIDLIEDNTATKQTIDQADDSLKTFDVTPIGSGGNVDYSNSRVTITAHGFENGDPVIYNNGGNTNIGGLLNNTVYYIRKISDDIVELNDDYALISKVLFLSTPTGIHSLERKTVNTIGDSLYVPDHGYNTGDAVRFESVSGSTLFSVDGEEVVSGSRFFVGSVTTNSFTLHNLRSDALSSINGLVTNAKDITAGSTGDVELVRNNVRVFTVVNTSSRISNNWNSLAATNIDASNIVSGTISPSRLASAGSANTDTFLRGDSSYQPVVQKLAKANTVDNPIVLNGQNINDEYFGNPVTITIQNANRDPGEAFSTLGTSRFLQAQFDVATDGSGAVFIKDNVIDAGTLQGLNSAYYLNPSNLSTPVPVNRGGTNITTYAVGDIIFAQTTGSLGTLNIGRNDTVITSTGSNPRWNTKINLAEDIGSKGGRVYTDSTGTAKIFEENASAVELGGSAGSVRIGNNSATTALTSFVAGYDATADRNVAVQLANFTRNTNSNVGNNVNELSFSNTASIVVGMLVSGSASIQANTVVTGVSGNFVYLSKNTVGTILTGTSITLTHTPESIGIRSGDSVTINSSGIANLDGTFPVSGASATANSFTIRTDDLVTANPANPIAGTIVKVNSAIIRNRTVVLGSSGASATPVGSIIKGEDGIGTNVVGGDITVQPGLGTGNTLGGNFVVKTGTTTTSGEARQASATRLTIDTAGNAAFTTNVSVAGNITLPDNSSVYVGTGNDLRIFHDGSNSRIRDEGTGELRLESNQVRIWTGSGENMIVASENGAVTLYYDNAAKLATKTDGVTITGDLASTTVTTTGNVVIGGDLTVNGTTTTINTTELSVDDKNIELGAVSSPTDVTADGGGITLKGTTDKTINWVGSTSKWTSSEDWNLLTGKGYYINNQLVLSGNTLGSNVVNSSLTSVGTITNGTWQGNIINSTYGGTGVNNAGRTITIGGNFTTSGAFTTTLTVTGNTNVTLPTSGTLAIIGSGLNQFASTTSAQLAGVISDETGSGSLVFGTSPTFTTSVIAGSASLDVFNTTATTVNAFGASTALTIGATTGTATIRNASVVLSGDLEVRGGDITTNQTTFNLINGTATTVNAFGASTALTIGATTGTATIRNATVTLNGDLNVNGGDIGTNQTTFNLINGTATTVNAFGAATTVNMGASTAGAKVVIARDLEVTNNLTINGTISVAAINSTPIGNLTPSTGAFTTLTANGIVTFTNNTASSSTSTGAVVVTGGLGVGGAVNAASFTGSINASNIDNGTLPDARIAVTGVTQHQASITGTGALNSGSITSGFGNINIGSSIFTGNGSGITDLNATNLTTGTVAGDRLGGNQSMAGVKTFTDTTEATSTTSGAVRIGGGLGVAGNIYAGNFYGNGANITNIAAGNIATGTIADARLPTSQTGKTFTSDITVHGYRFGRGGGNIATNIVAGGGASISTGTDNTAFGVGTLSAAVTGNFNTGFGRNTLALLTSSALNTAVGYNTLSQIASTTGRNTAIGAESMQNSITANDNVAVGYQALEIANSSENVMIGSLAGRSITTGSNNIAIGYNAQITSNTTSNEIVIGNANHNNFRIPGVTFTVNTSTVSFSGANGFAGVGTSLTALNASQLTSGTVPDARIAQTSVTQHQLAITGVGALDAGSITSNFGNINIGTSTFTGNGSGLTNLNATNLATGTVAGARLGGNQSMAGIKTFTDSTQSTSTTTGAVIVTGGVGIGGNLYVGGTLTANGANLTSLNADNLSSGTVPNARLSGSYTGITGVGTLTSGGIGSGFGNINIGTSTFTGNGSGLTDLNASNLASGSVPDARLSSNVVLLSGAQTLTGAKTFDANVTLGTSASLFFGSATRQMVNLFSNTYAIGVQSNTQYYRSASRFSWFRAGTHSNTENTPGTGGTVAMTLDSSSNLTVTGEVTATKFNGDGSGLTGVTAGALSSTITFNDLGTGGVSGSSYDGSNPVTISWNTIGAVTTGNTNQTIGGTKTFSNTITGSISGNAGTATTLATTRTIWGQNFNGGANVTGNLTSVGNITGSGAVTIATSSNGNLTLTPNGTGLVTISNATGLGGTLNNNVRVRRIQATTSNAFYNDLYVLRDAAGTDWTTARWHDAIGVDASFLTPRTDTRTWYERDPNNRIHEWGTDAVSSMTLSSSTTANASELTVSGTVSVAAGTAAAPTLRFATDTNTGLYSAGTDTIGFATSGVPAAQFTSTGNLRLFNTAGTFYTEISSQPTANRTLTLPDGNTTLVAGTMVTTDTTQTITANKTFSGNIFSTHAWDAANGGGEIYLNGTTGNRIEWNTAGTAIPAFTTRSAGTKLVLFPNIGAASVDYGLGIANNTLWSSVPTSSQQFQWYAGITAVATLSGAGNFTATGEVTAFSDIRLKDNIEIIADPLSKILKLRGVTYTRKDLDDKETRHMGVIAQEVEQYFPEVVHTDENGIKSVNYGAMAGAFIEAFKDQQAQIDELKALVQKLLDK
jgi:hypothetical protein